MKKNVFITATVVFFFLMSLSPSCSFADGSVGLLGQVEKPIWRIGDTWKYRIDGNPTKISRMVVQEITSEGYILAMGKKARIFYNRELNFLKRTDETGDVLEECSGSGMPTYNWPLKSGKSWSGSCMYYNRSASGTLGLMTFHVEVVGEEILTTADGQKVATLKILFKRENQNRKVLAQREYWYNPRVGYLEKRVDKRIISGIGKDSEVRELLSFTPGSGR